MTINETIIALKKRDQIIQQCERKLNQMQPAFLYDYKELDKWNDLLEKVSTQKEMLMDMLRGGDT